jgi:hypothetical protein
MEAITTISIPILRLVLPLYHWDHCSSWLLGTRNQETWFFVGTFTML